MKTLCLALALMVLAAEPAPSPLQFEMKQYKRIHRNAVLATLDGRAQEVVDGLATARPESAYDEEDWFVLGVAHLYLGDIPAAEAALKKALEVGLPVSRLLAERTSLLQKMPMEFFESLASGDCPQLVHGPMLAQLAPDSVAVWVRTVDEVQVNLAVHPAGGAAAVATVSGRTMKDADFTAVLHTDGLSADTDYEYRVTIGGKEAPDCATGNFRTAPPADQPAAFSVAFGGGAGYTPAHERMWDTILSHEPRAFFFMGDNTYSDAPEYEAVQRYCYYRRQSRPEFQRLTAATPIFAVWDDHDFATNDSWGGPEVDEPAWKRPVWNVFKNNWANPAYGGGADQPGIWFKTSIADVDFFLLDGRYYRTDPEAEQKSMLGPVQKQWLKESLRASKAVFKVIGSPVPFVKGTKGGSPDTWDGYAEEREELLAFIREQRIEGAFIISADRHRSDVWRMDWPEGYPIYEFESSRLTNIHTHEPQPGALFSYNELCSFGRLTFDTTAEDPTVTYAVINIDNEVMHEHTVARSELSFSDEKASAQAASTLRVAQLRGVPVKWDTAANMKVFLEQAPEAAAQQADILITPECWLDGYAAPDPASTPEKLREVAQPLQGSPYLAQVAETARRHGMWICFGFTSLEDGQIFNACGLWNRDGELTGVYHKTHIQTHDHQYASGQSLPVWPSEWGPLGMMICADRRWPETARTLRVQGAKLILNPTYGSHSDFNRQMMQVRSWENQCFIAFAHPEQSLLVDPEGEILANVEGAEPGITTTEINLALATDDNHIADRRPDLYAPLTE